MKRNTTNQQTKMAKTIPLTNSKKKATIDADMYPLISQYSWHSTSDGHAATYIRGELILMEHLVLWPQLAAKVGSQTTNPKPISKSNGMTFFRVTEIGPGHQIVTDVEAGTMTEVVESDVMSDCVVSVEEIDSGTSEVLGGIYREDSNEYHN